MSLYYFDASALVKYYVTEPGSTWVRELIDQGDPDTGEWLNTVSIAEVSLVEVAAALAVSARTGRLQQKDRDREYRHFMSDVVHRYSSVRVITADFEAAAELTQRHPLRAYDALQLAVALRYRQVLVYYRVGLTFVSSDERLLTAAEVEGLATDNPLDHAVPADVAGTGNEK